MIGDIIFRRNLSQVKYMLVDKRKPASLSIITFDHTPPAPHPHATRTTPTKSLDIYSRFALISFIFLCLFSGSNYHSLETIYRNINEDKTLILELVLFCCQFNFLNLRKKDKMNISRFLY